MFSFNAILEAAWPTTWNRIDRTPQELSRNVILGQKLNSLCVLVFFLAHALVLPLLLEHWNYMGLQSHLSTAKKHGKRTSSNSNAAFYCDGLLRRHCQSAAAFVKTRGPTKQYIHCACIFFSFLLYMIGAGPGCSTLKTIHSSHVIDEFMASKILSSWYVTSLARSQCNPHPWNYVCLKPITFLSP